MKRAAWSLILLLGIAAGASAQDLLYTIAGSKFQARVIEVNTTDVKYKDYANLEGPTYVISKREVVLIRFSDGSVQVLNDNPPTLSPQKTTASAGKAPRTPLPKKPVNLYYLNKNLLSINSLALANGDVTLLYDRDLLDNRLCLTVLGGYNFNPNMGSLNAVLFSSWTQIKKNYDAGLGISYMAGNTRRAQYMVGLLGKYMSYTYNENDFINGQSVVTRKDGWQMAVMINNGLQFRITPTFNMKLFAAVGVPTYSAPLADRSWQHVPKAYFGYCFGYRF